VQINEGGATLQHKFWEGNNIFYILPDRKFSTLLPCSGSVSLLQCLLYAYVAGLNREGLIQAEFKSLKPRLFQ
jgi:hypothetical protein